MVDTNLLKAKLKERKLTQEDAAKLLGINPSTFNRKINNEGGDVITVKEAEEFGKLLKIPNEQLASIFFAPKLAETQARQSGGSDGVYV